ncbi:aminoacyltransferase, partial [Enterobacter mori]
DDRFYYHRLRYYKNRVLVPLAYMDFNEYIEELKAEREVLSKDINKAIKDIEKRPENKKSYNKKDNLEQQLIANKQKIDEAKALRSEARR